MNKITLPSSLNTTKNVAVKLTKKYGVAVLATTAAVVIFSQFKENPEDEGITVIDLNDPTNK